MPDLDVPAAPAAEAPAATLPPVLLVDDEENILRSLRRLLRKDFALTATTSPEEALGLIRDHSYAVIVSDQRMPGMEGTDLMAQAQILAPDALRIILTGHADMNAVLRAINQGAVYRFLSKPWSDDELLATLRQAARQYELVQENKRLQALTEEQNQKLQAFNASLKQKVFERTRQVNELNTNLTQSFQGTIEVLARLADMNSPALGKHAKRVNDLSMKLGRALGLKGDTLKQLDVAATLHDIGKIGMHPDLMHKQYTELKPRDRAILLTHAPRGATLMKMIPNMEEAAAFVMHHHERFDGSGFPKRLRGSQIPIGARIIAVADAFDNTLNGRTAFGKSTPEKAVKHLRDHAGVSYDPKIVDALLFMLQNDREVVSQAHEVEIDLRDLQPGMVLSRDLYTVRGVLLLQKDHVIEDKHLSRLFRDNETDPIVGNVFVYRNAPRKPGAGRYV